MSKYIRHNGKLYRAVDFEYTQGEVKSARVAAHEAFLAANDARHKIEKLLESVGKSSLSPVLKKRAHSILTKAAKEAVKAYRASSDAEDYVENLLR